MCECACVCVHVHGCRRIQGGCAGGSPPHSVGRFPWGCSQVCVCAVGVCTARQPPCVCLHVCRACVTHGAGLRVRKCTHSAQDVCYGFLVRSRVCTLSIRCGARVCAACVDVPWALAGCTRAACPRRTPTAPDDAVGAKAAHGLGATRALGSPRWSRVAAAADAVAAFGVWHPLFPQAAPHCAGVSGAEEISAGLGSAEPGVAQKGSRIPEPGPPAVPAPLGAEVPESITSLPSKGSARCLRFAQCQRCPTGSGGCSFSGRQRAGADSVRGAGSVRVQAGAGTEGVSWTVGVPRSPQS